MSYTIRVTEEERSLLADTLLATDTGFMPETVARAVLATALRDLIALRPSDARLSIAASVRFLRGLEGSE